MRQAGVVDTIQDYSVPYDHSGEINAYDYGVINDGSDIGAALNTAAAAASAAGLPLKIPAGTNYTSSVSLDWGAYTNLEVLGAGHYATQITFTEDVIGINFGGRHIEGLRVTGIGASSTQAGIVYTTTQRKFAQRLYADGFYDGHRYDQGNLSHFNFIFGVSNVRHGFVNNNNTVDHHGATVGMMDLRGNGGDGLHIVSDTPNNVGQQMYGGLVVCQSNTGNAANISGRGHCLNVYDESNGGGVVLDANSEGCQITMQFGGATDSGTNNNVISARVGSVEAWVHSNLQYSQSELNNRSYTGRLVNSVTADRVFQTEALGTSSSVLWRLVHPTDGSSFNFDVDGRINGKKATNTDAESVINVSGFNLLEVTNTAATNINNLTNGAEGQEVTLVFMDANTTVVSGTSLRLAGAADFVASQYDTLKLVYSNPDWHEISRSVNS